jgi:hypothetical protein
MHKNNPVGQILLRLLSLLRLIDASHAAEKHARKKTSSSDIVIQGTRVFAPLEPLVAMPFHVFHWRLRPVRSFVANLGDVTPYQ